MFQTSKSKNENNKAKQTITKFKKYYTMEK